MAKKHEGIELAGATVHTADYYGQHPEGGKWLDMHGRIDFDSGKTVDVASPRIKDTGSGIAIGTTGSEDFIELDYPSFATMIASGQHMMTTVMSKVSATAHTADSTASA